MNREASLHINERNLILVLKSILIGRKFNEKQITLLANTIMIKGKRYSISNRKLMVDKAKLMRSTSRLVLSTRDDAGYLSHLITLGRRKLKHRGINIIKPTSKEWLIVKEICKLANDFCNDFNLPRQEGYKKYVELGLNMMTRFNLNKFNSIHQRICEVYGANLEISKDLTPGETFKVKLEYEKLLGEKGRVIDFKTIPEKYVWFIKAKEECHRLNVPIEHYIKAQFWGLEWCNGIPDPIQLVGNKAIDRLNKYLSEFNINLSQLNKDKNLNLAVKKLKEKWQLG